MIVADSKSFFKHFWDFSWRPETPRKNPETNAMTAVFAHSFFPPQTTLNYLSLKNNQLCYYFTFMNFLEILHVYIYYVQLK